MAQHLNGRALVVAMCVGQVGNLLPHVVLPSVMAEHMIGPWGLSGAEAGFMASSYAIGYMLAVPVLATLTDRIDARLVLLWGSIASALATASFGFLAVGFKSACLIWGLAGAGFAGAYMPGLKALSDRLDPGEASRSITYYTSSFSLGVSFSFLASQIIAGWLGWRAAFLLTALGPLAMIAAVLRLAPVPPRPSGLPLLDFRPVLRNRTAMGYVIGYGWHCFELYGIRSWLVAFWAFVIARNGGAAVVDPITVSFLFTLIAMPASIMGNELAIRFGRHRAITAVMALSALVAVAIGFAVELPPTLLLALLVVYAWTVPADSGALTSGMAASATATHRGATMAMHSTAGFGLSALGSWAFGVALDLGGGPASAGGWRLGFLLLAVAILMGPLALWWSRRGPAQGNGP